MNNIFKQLLEQIKKLWSKWTAVQKIIFFVIIAVSVIGLIMLVNFSASPSMVKLINTPITDENQRDKIIISLTEENVESKTTADNYIFVSDERTAQRMRAILIRDGIITDSIDPWALFDKDRWTLTDFERDVNLRRAITATVEQHIEALDDVDSAKVTLVMPEKAVFSSAQDPATASVIITPKPGSDISDNRLKKEGIIKLIQFAVQGLLPENITIVDHLGNFLDVPDGQSEADRLDRTERMMNQERKLEAQYAATILKSLRRMFSDKRVDIMNVDIDLEFVDKQIQTEKHTPIITVEDNPDTPYSEEQYVLSIAESTFTEKENFKGTGFNPEGPPGQEGQTPPAYKDLSSMVGEYDKDNETINYKVNTVIIDEDSNPYKIARMNIAVVVDGIWTKQYSDTGEPIISPQGSLERNYTPVSEEDLKTSESLVSAAVGFDNSRGDNVTVEHIKFDRTSQHEEEDNIYRRRKQTQQAILISLIGVAVIIVAAVIFRLVSKELERRRRLREEELSRQHQAMREAALRSAEEEGIDVEMSVQERARIEMQENAINMAREHPEDVAQLIRTWLVED